MEQTSPRSEPGAAQGETRPRSRRFAIVAPVRFSWTGPDGARKTGRGKTRDISLHGAFIWTWPVPMPGTAVEVAVEVPALVKGGTALRLHGTGTVLRVEPLNTQAHGFSVAVNFQTSEFAEHRAGLDP